MSDMSEQPSGSEPRTGSTSGTGAEKDAEKDREQVPGGGLAGNEEGASSDGDSGPEGAEEA